MLGHKMFQLLRSEYEVYATCRYYREKWETILPKDRLIQGVQAEVFDTVLKAFAKVKPNVVINCIGIIKQLDTAKDPILSVNINSLFPHRLALLCQSIGSRLIHFSTDCVFSGRKGNYTENDVSDAEDLYGRTKYLGEVGGDGCLTIRSSIIGRELDTKNGLVEWFISQKGKSVNGYSNAIYTGFTTNTMANIVQNLIFKHKELSGVWHITSNPISKYDLLKLINKTMNLQIDIIKDNNFQCNRSLNGASFQNKTGFVSPPWKDMIEELKLINI